MTANRFRVSALVVLGVITMNISLFPVTAYAAITTACRFAGPVTVNGQNAPFGIEVIASIDGTSGGPWSGHIIPKYGEFWYVVDVPADDPTTEVKEGGVNGEIVRFSVVIAGLQITGNGDTFERTSFRYHPLHTVTEPLIVRTNSLPDGMLKTAYTAFITAGGGFPLYEWTAAGIPAGLNVSEAGAVTGTPTASGSFSVVVAVTDSSGQPSTATAMLALRIWIPGDANGDDLVSVEDVTIVELIILGKRLAVLGADANLDGVINMGDVTKVEMIILGKNP
jgi:hypothetical protein